MKQNTRDYCKRHRRFFADGGAVAAPLPALDAGTAPLPEQVGPTRTAPAAIQGGPTRKGVGLPKKRPPGMPHLPGERPVLS